MELELFGFRRRWVAVVVAILSGIALVVEVLNAGGSDASHGVLIAIAGGVAAGAAKFFGNPRDDADEDAQGDHPAVRFLFQAVNAGEYEGAEDIVDPEFRAYAFGYPLGAGDVESGPALLVIWAAKIEMILEHGHGDPVHVGEVLGTGDAFAVGEEEFLGICLDGGEPPRDRSRPLIQRFSHARMLLLAVSIDGGAL